MGDAILPYNWEKSGFLTLSKWNVQCVGLKDIQFYPKQMNMNQRCFIMLVVVHVTAVRKW